MRFKELKKALRGKLGFVESNGSRHIDYKVVMSTHQIPLPYVVRVSQGDGEVPDKNIGGVAKAIGLTEKSLKEMVACNVGKGCVTISTCVRLLAFVFEQRGLQGEPFRPGLEAMLQSIELLLTDLEGVEDLRWSRTEEKALGKSRKRLKEYVLDDDLAPIARRILVLIDSTNDSK